VPAWAICWSHAWLHGCPDKTGNSKENGAGAFCCPGAWLFKDGGPFRDALQGQRRWDYVDRSAEFWTEFAKICPDGFSVHVENVYDDRPDDILSLNRKLENTKIGITLDIGHANIFSKIPVWEWIEAYGNRLTHVHLHDNNGEEDEHLPLGQGSIDLDRVIVALEENAPMAVWSIEAEPTASLAWLKSRGIWAG